VKIAMNATAARPAAAEAGDMVQAIAGASCASPHADTPTSITVRLSKIRTRKAEVMTPIKPQQVTMIE